MLVKSLVNLTESAELRAALASDPAAAMAQANISREDAGLLATGQRAKLRKRLMKEIDGMLDVLETPQDAAIHWPQHNGVAIVCKQKDQVHKHNIAFTLELKVAWSGEPDPGVKEPVQIFVGNTPFPAVCTNVSHGDSQKCHGHGFLECPVPANTLAVGTYALSAAANVNGQWHMTKNSVPDALVIT